MIPVGPYESADESNEGLADEPVLKVPQDTDGRARGVDGDAEIVRGRIGPRKDFEDPHAELVASFRPLLLFRERADSDPHGRIANLSSLAKQRVGSGIGGLLQVDPDRSWLDRIIKKLRRVSRVGGERPVGSGARRRATEGRCRCQAKQEYKDDAPSHPSHILVPEVTVKPKAVMRIGSVLIEGSP
jgi:hypothetical protein